MMAVQKFTPMGETRRFVSSSKSLISEDRYSYKKSKNMNLFLRHVSFTEVVVLSGS